MLKVLDLFSGIGGFSLGLERTGGFETVAFCEIDPFCRKVLAKHWPKVRQYEDVRSLTADTLRRDGIAVDVICGGFPCQDISVAGKGAGIEGERSGLWSEYARLIGELRPRYAIVENVAALLGRGLDKVLGDLAALGFDAEWHCIPASAIGAPHRRDRFWLIAYPRGEHYESSSVAFRWSLASQLLGADPNAAAMLRTEVIGGEQDRDIEGSEEMADASGAGLQGAGNVEGQEREPTTRQLVFGGPSDGRQWCFEPNVGRVAHGVPLRVDRLR